MKNIADYFNDEAPNHDEIFLHQMGMTEFYNEIEQQLLKTQKKRDILVLGCGTGLEIERIRWKANVTAIDISPGMINELEKKCLHPDIKLTTYCKSFFDYDFGLEMFDLVLTCYTMHHFNEKQKIELYKSIWNSLKNGGSFLNGDSMEKDREDELKRLQDAELLYKTENLPFGSLHIDVPFCLEHELQVLKKAGFFDIALEREWSNTKLYRAKK